MLSTMRQQSLFSGHFAISFWSDSKDFFTKPGSHSTTLDHFFLLTTRVVVGGLFLHIHMLSVSKNEVSQQILLHCEDTSFDWADKSH